MHRYRGRPYVGSPFGVALARLQTPILHDSVFAIGACVGALERLDLGRPTLADTAQSSEQAQTSQAFGYKWARVDLIYGSPAMQAFTRDWAVRRVPWWRRNPTRLDEWLADGRSPYSTRGAGSGYTALAFLGDRLRDHDYLGVDISDAVEVARAAFNERGIPGTTSTRHDQASRYPMRPST